MDGKEFVANWNTLRAELLDAFMAQGAGSEVAAKVQALGLSAGQSAQLRDILDSVIGDTMYALLLGLDGAASIGGSQEQFTISGEDGGVIRNIEEEAWECFHGDQP
ncbi:hypothetical protein [Achromobacter deleyi]|uniref:hypothetical protein n=1 Tax=Achromobacter deleyi TaxID=1353891 RepID=UPI0014929DAD|nr:hypothetical protein [Achromobacter deleyi]QVQ25378.1 hypothetical protein HLG70_21265 [Achromobacter deleyi]UIP20920.1 hypothetical protein LYZ39_28855 [Achromobacter deleyi]